MRRSLLAAGAALLIGAGAADASPNFAGGFVVESFRAQGTGALTGWDIVRFYALNQGVDATAGTTKLQSISVTETTGAQNLRVDTSQDIDGDGINDFNVLGAGMSASSPTGSFVRVGNYGTFNAVLVDPPIQGQINPGATYNLVTSIHVEGFQPPNNAPVANVGPGAQFAVAVVPAGTDLYLSGALAAEAGPAVPFAYAPLPEPATLGFLAATGLATVGGRRCRRGRAR